MFKNKSLCGFCSLLETDRKGNMHIFSGSLKSLTKRLFESRNHYIILLSSISNAKSVGISPISLISEKMSKNHQHAFFPNRQLFLICIMIRNPFAGVC